MISGKTIHKSEPNGEWKYVNDKMYIAIFVQHNNPTRRIDGIYTQDDCEYKYWLEIEWFLKQNELENIV